MFAACMTLKTANSSITTSFLVRNEFHKVSSYSLSKWLGHWKVTEEKKKEEISNIPQWLKLKPFPSSCQDQSWQRHKKSENSMHLGYFYIFLVLVLKDVERKNLLRNSQET